MARTAKRSASSITVLLDPNGRVRAGVIEFGGFLGIGEHKVAVPWNEIEVQGDRLMVNLTKDEVKAMPRWQKDRGGWRVRRVQAVPLSARAGTLDGGGRTALLFYACSNSIKRAAEILRVQEQHRLVVGAKPGFAVAEDSGAAGAQPVAGGDDVVDLIADVMHAAGRVFVEKPAHRRGVAERLQQFDFRVRQLDEHDRDAMGRQRLRR